MLNSATEYIYIQITGGASSRLYHRLMFWVFPPLMMSKCKWMEKRLKVLEFGGDEKYFQDDSSTMQ